MGTQYSHTDMAERRLIQEMVVAGIPVAALDASDGTDRGGVGCPAPGGTTGTPQRRPGSTRRRRCSGRAWTRSARWVHRGGLNLPYPLIVARHPGSKA